MRTLVALLLFTGSAAAQAPPGGYLPSGPAPSKYAPPGYVPPGYVPSAHVAPGGDGARPGNDIGTGMSLPRSDTAGNLNAATTHSELAPNLPAPPGLDTIRDLLMDARDALAARRTGEAQEALERAETRALDRDIPVGTERIPAQGGFVAGLNQARDALAHNDLQGAIAIINGLLRQ